MNPSRRRFILFGGRLIGTAALVGAGYRVFSGNDPDLEFTEQPVRPYRWRINPDKCVSCDLCETACVRKPSAVKAVNDQVKCSYCVACYGHLKDLTTPSERIQNDAEYVCPYDAVLRTQFNKGGDTGYHLYHIDPERCTGCGKCAKQCNEKGTRSMFLFIRPDLCLGCHRCTIAAVCPENAVERDYDYPECEDDYRGDYELDQQLAAMDGGGGGWSDNGLPEDCGERERAGVGTEDNDGGKLEESDGDLFGEEGKQP